MAGLYFKENKWWHFLFISAFDFTGIISTGYDERIAAFTPDGKEFCYVLYGAPHMIILFTKEENGRWTKPRVTPFSDKYGSEFNISPDGNKIVFASFNGIH